MPSLSDVFSLHGLIATYGYYAVFTIVMLESAGVPLPGETALVTAAIYAGTTGRLDITALLATAAAAAIIGDNFGYWVGRRFGFEFLRRHGKYVHLTEARLRLGQYLFFRHGGKIVFFGRFVAFLRTFAAVLAGVNLLPWGRFLFFNAAGGIVWALAFGLGAYILGQAIENVTRPLAVIGVGAALTGALCGALFFRYYERQLQAAADAHFQVS